MTLTSLLVLLTRLDDYADHKETKSGGDIVGLLPRLRMKIDRNLIKYVGKEVSNLDASNVLGVAETSESHYI